MHIITEIPGVLESSVPFEMLEIMILLYQLPGEGAADLGFGL